MEFAPQNSFCMKMTDIGIIPMKIFVFIKCGVETSLGGHKDQIKRRQGPNIFCQSTTASYDLILSRERAGWWRRGRERGGRKRRGRREMGLNAPIILTLQWYGRAGTYQVSNLFSLYWEIFIKGVIIQCYTCRRAFFSPRAFVSLFQHLWLKDPTRR